MKTLIIRPGGIGDCILCFPAMEHLRSEFTEVWVPSPVVPIVQCADAVQAIASTGIDVVGLPGRSLPQRLREFDRIVSWYGTNRPEFREAVSGLPFEFHAALPPADSTLHATDFFLHQTGAPPGSLPMLNAEPKRLAATIIHPFSGGRKKNWPLQHFRRVAQALGDVCWLAGPDEQLDMALHFDTLDQVAQGIAGADRYLGNDSGITHLAAALGSTVIAIFGPSDPRIWAPRGPRVQVLVNPTPDDVLRLC